MFSFSLFSFFFFCLSTVDYIVDDDSVSESHCVCQTDEKGGSPTCSKKKSKKVSSFFLYFSFLSVMFPFFFSLSLRNLCLYLVTYFEGGGIHLSSSSLVQSWPCTKRHFRFACEALSFASTNLELIGWVRHTGNDEDPSTFKTHFLYPHCDFNVYLSFFFFLLAPSPFTIHRRNRKEK